MFCPQCGSVQTGDVRFCKTCGVNLQAVRQAVATEETGEKFDWSKTWVAEMFLSEGERKRRAEEMERQRGITPEVKRYKEIKAGVITSSIGIALMLFLKIFMQGIVLGGNVPPDAVPILLRVWASGMIPFFVGMALMINGVFVSKKLVEATRRAAHSPPALPGNQKEGRALPAADTAEFIPAASSVTEETTRHLESVSRRSSESQ